MLYYLSTQDTQGFYRLIQSIKLKHLNDESIQFILQIEDCMIKCDTSRLMDLSSKCGEESKNLMEMLIDNLKKKVKNVLAEDIGRSEVIEEVSNDEYKNIKDCIFICKSFPGN